MSHTPFSETQNTCPSRTISVARTTRINGFPFLRRATTSAVRSSLEMDVGACARDEARGADGRDEGVDRPVKETRGRLTRRQAQIDRNRMPLVRANARSVGGEREALLVARAHDLFEVLARHLLTLASERREHVLDRGLARRVQMKVECRRIVAKTKAQ